MSPHTRRTFLLAAGGGAAVAAVATRASLPDLPDTASRPSAGSAAITADNPLVAYVRDVRSGEIAVMAGDREVVFTDKALASRLAREIR